MTKNRVSIAILLAVFLLPPMTATPGEAQTVLVDLEMGGSGASLLEGGFRSAIEGLEGVALAGSDDLAHYGLNATVLCVPEPTLCNEAESYTVSVVLTEPVTPTRLADGLSRTGDDVLERWRPTPEARAFLQRFRRIHAQWAASWDRESWEGDVERLVGGIDARCFQQRRLVEARRESLLRRGDTLGARSVAASPDPSGRSLC